ncbi:MAG: CPBP family intramembrane glutamic endopeptidase [Promethearchaeota archaeon]
MAIELGADPWKLILIMLLELLFILLPAIIAGKIERRSFKEELKEMGLRKNDDSLIKNLIKIGMGLSIGTLLFVISGYIIYFFKILIVENLFGTEFVKEGERGAIHTRPIQPNVIQIIIIIILQVLLVGICEETFFRGFILNKFKYKIKQIYAVLISSISFTLYHIPPFLVPLRTIITYFGYFFTFGILLCIVFYLFDHSLIPCITAHAFFNILILLIS